MDLVTLRHVESKLVLAPGLGGGIFSWTDKGRPILRPPLPNALDLGLVRSLAAYPLVPFSNRIDHGVFHFAGVRHELPVLAGGHAIHGVGWKRPWQVTQREDAAATIVLQHAPDELWPFAFRAEQRFTLAAGRLTWGMRMVNLHDGPAPAGLGFHPYFPRGNGCRLQFDADRVWFGGPDSIPMRLAKVPAEWDHRTGRKIGSTLMDNCFVGWRQPAILHYDTHLVSITADPIFRFLVAFVPEDKDFFAVEPVSHMNDGLNRMAGSSDDATDHGVAVLNKDEALGGDMHFEVADL